MVIRFKGRMVAAACLGLSAFAFNGTAFAAPPAAAVAVNPDQRLAEAIAAKLGTASHINGYQVDVTCEAGTVELSGSVKDAAQRADIIKVVRSVKGVNQVIDHMAMERSQAVQRTQAVENIPGPAFQGGGMPNGAPQGLPMEAFNGGEPPAATNAAPMNSGPGCAAGNGRMHGGPAYGGQGGVPMGEYPMGDGSGDMGGGYGAPPPGAMINYGGDPMPIGAPPTGGLYDAGPPKMPSNAWPTYAPHNNYSRVAYPQQYPAQAFPFIGPFYPFPKVPPGYRAIKLEWEDGAWYYGRNATHRNWWSIRYW